MKHTLPLVLLALSTPAIAETTRQLDSHEHGVGELNIAIDGTTVAMELHAPGADIVGFEYEATSEADLAKIENALAVLADPAQLFSFPDAAKCSVTQASAELEGDEGHDDHDDHGDEKHEDHDDKAHDDHDHDEHEDEKHDEDDHEDHADEASHTEFHAEFTMTCTVPNALTTLGFPYFGAFENALELEVQVVSANGAMAFEVERDAPTLDLGDLN